MKTDRIVIAAALSAFIIAFLFLAPLLSNSNVRHEISTLRLTSVATGTDSTTDLALVISLNATTIRSGEGVAVTISDYNTLSRLNNVSEARSFALPSLRLGPCNAPSLPLGVAVFDGHYTQQNVSSAVPLITLYKPGGATSCPAEVDVGYFAFQPMSSENTQLVLMCTPEPQCVGQSNMSATVVVTGYWTGPTFQHFEPGVYTVAGGDQWGQLALLYFIVS